jgi:hypothetical protein
VIGVAEIVIAVLIEARTFPPDASALGSVLSGSARNSWGQGQRAYTSMSREACAPSSGG